MIKDRVFRNYIIGTLIKFLKRHEGEKVVMSDLMPTLFTRLSEVYNKRYHIKFFLTSIIL